MPDRKKIIRWLLLSAYFVAAFLVFLVLLLPYDRIKTKLENETRRRTGIQLSIGGVSPRFLNSLRLRDVVVSDSGGKVLFESPSVNVTVSLFNLLRNTVAVRANAQVYGGDLLIKTRQNPASRYLLVDANGLDIGSVSLLKSYGLKLNGKLGGTFEMTNDTGKGRWSLKGLTSRELKIKGLPVPDLDFDQGWLEAEVHGDRLTIKKFDLDGKDLQVRCLGDLVMRERGTINLTFKLKPSERLSHEQAGLLGLLKNKDAEGFYQFSLGGTLTEPMPRL